MDVATYIERTRATRRHVVSMFTACLLLQLLFYLSLRVYILLSYKHPRCSVFDGLAEYTQSICKPTAAEGDEYYCGQHPLGDVSSEQVLQAVYECGLSGGDDACPDERCLRYVMT